MIANGDNIDEEIRQLQNRIKQLRAQKRQAAKPKAKRVSTRPKRQAAAAAAQQREVITIEDDENPFNEIDDRVLRDAPATIPEAPPLRQPAEVRRRMNEQLHQMNEEWREAQQENRLPTAQRIRAKIERFEQGLSALIEKHHLEPIVKQGIPNFQAVRQRIHDSLRADPPEADFSELSKGTNQQLRMIENDIKEFFQNEWGSRHVDKKLKLCCRLYSSSNQRFWRSFPLSPFNYKQLMKNLNEHGFLIHCEEASDWESDQASRPLPEWSEIREMKILPITAKVKGEVRYNMREGGFFPYLLRPDIHSKPLLAY